MASQVGKICIEVEKTTEVGGVEQKMQFQFLIPMGCPLGVAFDSAFEVLQEIMKMSQIAVENADRNKEKETGKEA